MHAYIQLMRHTFFLFFRHTNSHTHTHTNTIKYTYIIYVLVCVKKEIDIMCTYPLNILPCYLCFCIIYISIQQFQSIFFANTFSLNRQYLSLIWQLVTVAWQTAVNLRQLSRKKRDLKGLNLSIIYCFNCEKRYLHGKNKGSISTPVP